jgi:hypothetical protein
MTVLGRVNSDIRNTVGFKYDAPRGPNVRGDKDGRYRAFDRRIQNWNFEGLLTYNRTFNEFTLDANGGARSWLYGFSEREGVNEQLLEIPGVISLNNNAGITDAVERDQERRLHQGFVWVTGGYKGTYFLNATYTKEWSSTLSPDNQDFDYYSIGGSVILSELLPSSNILTFAKIRASYALTGNSAGPYDVSQTYQFIGNYNGQAAILRQSPRRANPNLKNEETSSLEFGIETILLNDRIRANFTYYENESYDQIVPGNVPTASGFATAVANAGLLTNKGFEVFLSGTVIDSPIRWDIDLNWSNNKNRVVHLDLTGEPGSFGFFTLNNWSFAQIRAIPGEFYGSIVSIDHLKDPEGRPLVDAETGLAIEAPNSILGNAQPDWLGSVRNTVTWKGLSLSFLIDIKAGGDLLSLTHARSSQFGVNKSTLEGRDEFIFSSRILGENNLERRGDGLENNFYNRGDRVQGAIYEGVQYFFYDPDGDGNGVFLTDGTANDIYIDSNQKGFLSWRQHWRSTFDASYVKLRELTLGYTLPSTLLNKTPLRSVKVSLVGRNLWIIHQNTPRGIDPEANSTSGNGQGMEYGAFLPSRSVGFNLNLSF